MKARQKLNWLPIVIVLIVVFTSISFIYIYFYEVEIEGTVIDKFRSDGDPCFTVITEDHKFVTLYKIDEEFYYETEINDTISMHHRFSQMEGYWP